MGWFVEGQERRAKARIAQIIAHYDHSTLRSMGLDEKEIERLIGGRKA